MDDRGRPFIPADGDAMRDEVVGPPGPGLAGWRWLRNLVLLVLPWTLVVWAFLDSTRSGVVEMLRSTLVFALLVLVPFLGLALVRALLRRKGPVAESTPEPVSADAHNSVAEEAARPREPLTPVAASLTANRRCGSCAFTLDPGTKDSHGFVTCPECGATWHTDRFMPPDLAPPLKEMSASVRLAGRVSGSPSDDRGVACTVLSAEDSRLSRVIGSSMIRSISIDLAHLRKKRASGWFVIALGVGVLGPMVALLGGNEADLAIGMSLVIAALLVVHCVFQVARTTFAEARSTWLAHARCPCCAASLLELETRFDACVSCPGCARAWRVNDVRTKTQPEHCPRCSYAMAGLTRCPECAYPSRWIFEDRPPGSMPLCARCSTALPGEHRACPRCGVMAGVRWG